MSEEKPPHNELAAKLLKDAAAFFKTISEQNPPLAEQMSENRQVFLQVADLVLEDPTGSVEGGATHNTLAAKLLRDAAKFFETIANANKPLKDQMKENSDVFLQVADLVETDPEGLVQSDTTKYVLPEKSNGQARAESESQAGSFDKPNQPKQASQPAHSVPQKPPSVTNDIEPISVTSQPLLSGRFLIGDVALNISIPCVGQPDPPWFALPIRNVDEDRTIAAANARDDYTCQFCGFRSTKYLSVVSRKFGACIFECISCCDFCSQCLSMEQAVRMRSGVLIWLPEMKQTLLNRCMIVLYASRIAQGKIARRATTTLAMVKDRETKAKEMIDTSSVADITQRLLSAKDPLEFKSIQDSLKHIRLLPLDRQILKDGDLEFNRFPQMLAFWRSKNGAFPVPPSRLGETPLDKLAKEL